MIFKPKYERLTSLVEEQKSVIADQMGLLEKQRRLIEDLTRTNSIHISEAANWKVRAQKASKNEREALERVEELAEEAVKLRRKLYFRERVERGIFGFDCDGDHVRGVFDDKCLRCRKSTDEED